MGTHLVFIMLLALSMFIEKLDTIICVDEVTLFNCRGLTNHQDPRVSNTKKILIYQHTLWNHYYWICNHCRLLLPKMVDIHILSISPDLLSLSLAILFKIILINAGCHRSNNSKKCLCSSSKLFHLSSSQVPVYKSVTDFFNEH